MTCAYCLLVVVVIQLKLPNIPTTFLLFFVQPSLIFFKCVLVLTISVLLNLVQRLYSNNFKYFILSICSVLGNETFYPEN